MLRYRVLSATVLVPIVLAAAYLGGLWFVALVLLVAVLAGWEFFRLLLNNNMRPMSWLGLLAIVSLILTASQALNIEVLSVLAAFCLISLVVSLFHTEAQPVTQWAWTMAGATYFGVLLSHFVLLRNLPHGFAWFVLGLLLTWTADTAAYFVGRALGRHPLWPRHSPKKTWEGAVGGWVAATLAGAGLARWLVGVSPLYGGLIGASIAVLAPFGDLAESMIKRQLGAKDSGTLIPGHGGMWDRIDSLLFVIPLVYYWARLLAGLP